MGRDDQLAEFERFDFDGDARFKEWLCNVEVMGNDPAMMRKLRAKWYKRTIVSEPSA